MVEIVDQHVTRTRRRGSWGRRRVIVVAMVGRGLVAARGGQDGAKVNEEERMVMEDGVWINGDGWSAYLMKRQQIGLADWQDLDAMLDRESMVKVKVKVMVMMLVLVGEGPRQEGSGE